MYTAHTSTHQAMRRQYSSDRLETASNTAILILCFDRLDRDLTIARSAIDEGDHFGTHEALRHAQDLLGELATMLDVTAWEHAGSLLAIYDYVLRLLAKANMLKAAPLVVEAQRLLAEIGDAFRSAAGQVDASMAADAQTTTTDVPSVSVRA